MEIDSSSILTSENPFPGLRSFEIHDSHLFFGREKNIKNVLDKLFAYRFVAIVGSSGSGKSSLIRAGLLPLAYKNLDRFSGEKWNVAIFHPGNSPLNNLVKSLASLDIFGNESSINKVKLENDILNILKESEFGLIEVLRKYNPEKQPVLILLDQFEELFRFQNKERLTKENIFEAEKFVTLFTEAIQQRDVPIYLILTIRADFLGDCARFEGLPEAINDGQYLIPQMSPEQIKSAILKPFELTNGKISPRLLQQLITDIKGKQDQLPIMQHSMMRAWEKWKQSSSNGHPLDIEHYELIGTMSKALSQHADEVFNGLQTERQKQLAEIIFKTLTVQGTDNRGIRRPTTLNKLSEIADATDAEIAEVLDQFRSKGRTFITPALPIKLTSETIIDISHESLMRIWERLQKWVEEEYQSALIYIRLSESAHMFEEGKSALWRDPELQFALEWKGNNQPNKAWSLLYNNSFDQSIRFLDLSLSQRNLEKKKERRRRLFATAFISLFFISCSFLTMWALSEKKTSAISAEEAMKQKQIADLQTDTAFQMKTKAEQRSIELAKQKSLLEIKSNEAEVQKQLAQSSEKKAVLNAEEKEKALLISETEKQNAQKQTKIAEEAQLKAEDEKNKKEKLRLLNVAQTIAFKSISKFDDEQLPALLALQSYQFNIENDGAEQDPVIYEALHKSLENININNRKIINVSSEYSAFGFNEKNQSLIAASVDGNVISLNLKNLQQSPINIKNIHSKGNINSIYLSTEGRYLAVAYDNFSIVVWDLNNNTSSGTELKGHSGYLRTIVFDKNNKKMASAGKDSTILVWDLENLNGTFSKKIKLNEKVSCLAFCSTSLPLAAGSDDGLLTFWNYDANKNITSLNNSNSFLSLAYSRNYTGDELLAAGFTNGKVKLYSLQKANANLYKIFADFTVGAEKICFNKAGEMMAISGADKLIRIYTLNNFDIKPIVLKEQNAKVRTIIFDNNDRICIAYSNNKIQVLDTRCKAMAEKVYDQLTRNMTEAEWRSYVGSETPYRKTCIKAGLN